MKANSIIGIDAGGTTTRVLVMDAANREVVLEVQGASAADGGPALDAPLRAALEPIDLPSIRAVCAGITKITRGGVREHWETALAAWFPAAQIAVVPDYVVAFHGATGGIGIAVVAGTGSVVYGEDGRGSTVRIGGRGWEYGDEGSGTWLTTEMVRRTLRTLDGIAPATPLSEAVCDSLETRDPARLAERARRRADEQGRGFLVPLARDRAESGDNEARNLFVGAAGWLGLQTKAAHSRLVLEGPFPVATVGGLWEAGDLLREPFRRVVARWLPEARVIAPRESPVLGAARRAAALLPR